MKAAKIINPLHLKAAKHLTHSLFASLLLMFFIWQFTRSEGPSYVFLVVQCLPLAILIPGLVRQHPRTYIWLCFIMLVYFVKGVDGMVSPSHAWIDTYTLIVSIALFISSMFTSRWMQHTAFHTSNPLESSN